MEKLKTEIEIVFLHRITQCGCAATEVVKMEEKNWQNRKITKKKKKLAKWEIGKLRGGVVTNNTFVLESYLKIKGFFFLKDNPLFFFFFCNYAIQLHYNRGNVKCILW